MNLHESNKITLPVADLRWHCHKKYRLNIGKCFQVVGLLIDVFKNIHYVERHARLFKICGLDNLYFFFC
mgnify:CR=1 FL=1